MTNLKLAVIPGDGIGQEIVPEGIKALEAVIPSDVTLQYTEFDLGARRYHRTGEILTDTDLEVIDQHDAILLGAIGDPSVPSGVLERGLLLKLRFSLDHYVNLRPSHYYPGVPTPLANPGDIDFIVVREGTESLYAGNGGTLRKGTIHEVAQEISVNTAPGALRIRTGSSPSGSPPHPGPQAQCFGLRWWPVEPHRRGSGPRIPAGPRRLLPH